MSTATTTKPGTLVGFLATYRESGGTCLMYGQVVRHEPGDSTRTGRVTVTTPDGGLHRVSDHGDFIEAHALNATCEKCGTDVWRNPWRGAHEGIPDVDATGSAKCPKGRFHGAHTD